MEATKFQIFFVKIDQFWFRFGVILISIQKLGPVIGKNYWFNSDFWNWNQENFKNWLPIKKEPDSAKKRESDRIFWLILDSFKNYWDSKSAFHNS